MDTMLYSLCHSAIHERGLQMKNRSVAKLVPACMFLCSFVVTLFMLPSWPGRSWKLDFNLNETFTWLNKGYIQIWYIKQGKMVHLMHFRPLKVLLESNIPTHFFLTFWILQKDTWTWWLRYSRPIMLLAYKGFCGSNKIEQSEPSSLGISSGARTQPRNFRHAAKKAPKREHESRQEGDFQLEPPLPEAAVVLLSVWIQKQRKTTAILSLFLL